MPCFACAESRSRCKLEQAGLIARTPKSTRALAADSCSERVTSEQAPRYPRLQQRHLHAATSPIAARCARCGTGPTMFCHVRSAEHAHAGLSRTLLKVRLEQPHQLARGLERLVGIAQRPADPQRRQALNGHGYGRVAADSGM